MRKLASVRKVEGILPIEGADAIEVAVVGGWKCVVKKGEFTEGDLGVYFEIDSKLPEREPFLFMEKSKFIVKTIRLRGQLSQGLLLPLHKFDLEGLGDSGVGLGTEGSDVTEILGVEKWEPAVEYTQGDQKGPFPYFIRKSDQERIQNLVEQIDQWRDIEFEITEKLEGSSSTWYFYNGVFGACSRTLEMHLAPGSRWEAINQKYDLEAKLRAFGKNIAIQAEMIGPKIQDNIYNLKEVDIRIFDVFDIETQSYMTPQERAIILRELNLEHILVPLLGFEKIGTKTVEELLEIADGESLLGAKRREGLVYKAGDISFKTVSNEYLLKGGK